MNSQSQTENENENTKQKYKIEKVLSFEDLELKENLLRGIYGYGFENPSQIQQIGIKPILEKYDVIAQSQSGTGKTATFSISMLQRINENEHSTQGIILTHVRELALQINNVVSALSTFMNIKICLTVGGTSIKDNIAELNNNPHIVIGTPGRVLDMINKKALNTRYLKLFVIDEADEMLSKIFLNQIYDIFRFLPQDIQVALFSATMNNEFFSLTKRFMRNPVELLLKNDELTLEGIKQFYVNVAEHVYKYDCLCDLFDMVSISQSIIYCNSKKGVMDLVNRLTGDDFSVLMMHGDMTQEERNVIMNKFRQGEGRIMVSTDLLARGIDIQQISIVLNYDLPNSIENYIHRIGRSGRYGRKGTAINFATDNDIKRISELESYYSTQIEQLPDKNTLATLL